MSESHSCDLVYLSCQHTHLILEFDVYVSLVLFMLKEDLCNLHMSTCSSHMKECLPSLDNRRKRGGGGGGDGKKREGHRRSGGGGKGRKGRERERREEEERERG